MADEQDAGSGWMADVQRALALIFVVTFCLCFGLMIIRVTFWADIPTVSDLLKILIPAMITFVAGVAGYFYGSSKSKEQSDATQGRVMEKLTSTPPGTLPPPPGGDGAPVPPWWSRLTDDEKNAITAASTGDPRVAAFVTASQVGAATADDLAYLVTAHLLTQERATAIKG